MRQWATRLRRRNLLPRPAFVGRRSTTNATTAAVSRGALAVAKHSRADPTRAAFPRPGRRTWRNAEHRRPLASLARNDAVTDADLTGRLALEVGRPDRSLEIGKHRVVIVRLRGIEQDHVETAVDHRADDAATAP